QQGGAGGAPAGSCRRRANSSVWEVRVAAVALVTGGTGGIGRAICRRLAVSGFTVVAGDVDVTGEPGPQGVAGRSIVDFPLDVADEESVRRCVAAAADLGPLA